MKIFERGELKLLWPFYLSQFISSLLFIFTAFYVIYFQEKGFSFFQISTLMAVFGITPLFFEMPTGVIADLYGRKFSVIVGEFLFGFSVLGVFLTSNYYLLILIFAIMGISVTFSSGAWEAWITDLLKSKRKSNLLHNFFIKQRSITSLGFIFAGVLGGLIVTYFGLNSIWLFSGLPFILSGFLLLFFADEGYFVKKERNILKAFKDMLKYSKFSINYSLKHPVLLFLILATFLISFNGSMAGMLMWQPFLVSLDFPVAWLGYLLSIGAMIAVGLPFLSKPLLKLIGKEKNYFAVNFTFYIFIIFLILFTKNWYFAVLIFLLGVFPFELTGPVKDKYFQKHTLSKYRATISSFHSMVSFLGATIGILFAGFLAGKIGPKMTIFYSLFFMIPVVIFYLMIKDKH